MMRVRSRPDARPVLAALVLSALALGAARAPAAVDAGARRVLERYLEATGGLQAWERETTAHARLRVQAYGMEGATERWLARPDRSASSTRLGALTLREGVLGGRAWRLDQNGKLAWLDGPELAQAQSATWFDLEMWLAPDQGGGRVRHAGQEKEGATTLEVLEMTPPGGRPWRLGFDRGSGHLVRMTLRDDQRRLETRFSDFALLGGRLRPRRMVTRIDGMAANDVVSVLDSVTVGIAADSALFLPPRQETRDFRFLGGGRRATVPMEYAVRHVWVKVSVNGKPPEDFLLDTGASVTVLDSAFAARIGIAGSGEITAHGAGASGRMAFARLGTLQVGGEDGGVELSGQNVMVAALRPFLAPAFWRDTAGILGYDFLSRFVTTVDYAGGKLVLHDPEGFTYDGKGAALPMTFHAGVPVVPAKLDGVYEGEFRLDVGSGSSVDLHTPFVKRHELEKKAGRLVPDPAGGFGGSFERQATRMRSFALGPFVIENPLVSLSQATVGAMASEHYAGNIGNRVLDRFTCTFDYGRKTLYLEPNARFGRRDEHDRFGARLLKLDGRVTVGHVIPGSAAAEAGLAPGDEVATIAGKPAAEYTPDALRVLFEDAPAGTPVRIETARGGERRTLEVKLRSLL